MSIVAQLAQKLFSRNTLSEAVKPTSSTTLRDLTRFAAGDRVLINGRRLSNPLRPGTTNPVPQSNYQLRHDDVLGQTLGTLKINGPDGRYIKVQQPTLDQYVSLTRRNVTPIYAPYAATIVSLLDIHPTAPPSPSTADRQPRLEILEAGTGHGSLTLHLARAIAAANWPAPLTLLPPGRQTEAVQVPTDTDWASWLTNRHAIVHTVEKVHKNSRDAEKLIREFRQGIYWPHIDFYTGGVDTWLQDRLTSTPLEKREFLSHVILDMPNVESILPLAAQAMREDALVAVFCPSVTQIAECQRLIKEQGVPLVAEKTVELGEGISTGRVWDVRVVTPRRDSVARPDESAVMEQREDAPNAREANMEAETDIETETDVEIPSSVTNGSSREDQLKFVCRPKVGERTFGGGFLGLWRKSTSK